MKRYYLSRIFQDVTGEYGMPGAWMHQLQTYPDVKYAAGEIAVDPGTGIPTQKALLVLVDQPNHVPFVNDPRMADFPEVSLDTKASSVDTAAKNRCKGKMRALGLRAAEVDDIWQQADGVRDIVNRLGRLNNPAFNSLDFDV